MSEREATVAEYEDYLRTTTNRDDRPYEEATINVYIGYPLSAIEQAVADGVPYTGTDDGAPDPAQLAQAVTAPDADPGNDQPGDRQGADEAESCQAA